MKDFSGDGKITQKDVLMGRGVIDKPPMRMMKEGGVTIEDTTKTIDVPTPKPFTNPIKTAINKIPSQLERGAKFVAKSAMSPASGALLNSAFKAGQNAGNKKIPDNIKKKVAMRKIKNVAKDVFKRD
tara:strand:+ start:867 stop:1247 length:381 start_codon:yes stop_codon:yes gene_type:complete